MNDQRPFGHIQDTPYEPANQRHRPCMLVIMGATPEGKKERVGLLDGERESKIYYVNLRLRGRSCCSA